MLSRSRGDVSLGELAFAEPLAVGLHAVQPRRRSPRQVGADHRRRHDRLPDGDGRAPRRRAQDHRHATSSIGRSRRRSRSAPTGRCAPTATPTRSPTPQFDVAYEVSGNFAALKTLRGRDAKRGGVIVQVGTLPHEPLPFVVNELMAKELDLRGAFRWGIEFDWAVDYLSTRRVDVRPLLSGQFPLQDAVTAFALAQDKTQSTKVQVVCVPDRNGHRPEPSTPRRNHAFVVEGSSPSARLPPRRSSSAGPAAAQQKLKWAHVYETSEPYHTESVWAAAEIKKRTNGKFDIEVFPASHARQGDRHQPGPARSARST